MLPVYSFFDELQKIAFGPTEMRKVLSLSAKKALKMPAGQLPVGSVAFPKSIVPAQRGAVQTALSAGQISPEQASSFLQVARHGEGKMVMPHRSYGVTGQLRDMGMPADLVPRGQSRMATESLMRGHEMDELALGARKSHLAYAAKATHMSPDVILRERNRLVTMPEKMRSDVAGVMEPLRGYESPVLEQATRGVSGKGLDYATGPRLSRHARHRVSQKMEEITLRPETPGPLDALRGG